KGFEHLKTQLKLRFLFLFYGLAYIQFTCLYMLSLMHVVEHRNQNQRK
ncbi:MAG: hypothetical protein ACJA1U_002743, partial [Bermanella sp.]